MKFFKRFKKVSRIKLIAPLAAPERHGIAIAAIIKDEADYLHEWIAFHRQVGVRYFCLYDNGSSDDTVAIAKQAMGDHGVIIPFAGGYHDDRLNRPIDMQALAFAHAISNFGAEFRWMAFIDPDEFLLPKTGDDLNDILTQHLHDEINVSLPWHMFGSNGHHERPDGLTIANDTTRYQNGIFPQTRYPFKLLVDPCQVEMISPHQCRIKRDSDQSVNDMGSKSRQPKSKSTRVFFIGTYFIEPLLYAVA